MKERFLIFWYNPGGTRSRKKADKKLAEETEECPPLIVTDKLRHIMQAFRELRLTAEHSTTNGETIGQKNSHQPVTKAGAGKMQRFKSPRILFNASSRPRFEPIITF